ncbi:hypothetical protein ASG47_09085 [Devosia sp. Leaf420]|uniref:hypothetical protein n=1 Tax=Devosia sp. Leaf420 TaxID=1736374 RepID=UPI0007128218|nr:hypothetical protein [Devosia sp. Leaf420]KQT48489.1 hypothetical protein ASG47_09085 [Devosia sp. Leaf420]
MPLRNASAGLAFVLTVLSIGHVMAAPSAQCVPNADKSQLQLIVSNSADQNYACIDSCQYKVTGQRPLQTLGCQFALNGGTAENVACDVKGDGPDYFGELRPTKYTCQPR